MGETVTTSFEAKLGETIPVILRRNHRQTVDLGFDAQPRNSRSLSPHAWYRPHTVSPELSIIKPPSTRPVLDHPWSSAPGLLLLPRTSSLPTMPHLPPVHHETNKHDSPNERNIKVKQLKRRGFRFKPHQINNSS
jgi:hypothetical protein